MNKSQELLEEMQLWEMTNVIPKYTGLKGGTVYISTSRGVEGHSLGRVKFEKSGEWFSTSIKTKKDGTRKSSGNDERVMLRLNKFVENNEKILWDFWNSDPLKSDVTIVISKLKKV